MTSAREVFISVDVETAGPIPGEYSLLSIGACLVYDDAQAFSALLKPINNNADPKALEVTGLSLDRLSAEGEDPAAAMRRFADWIASVVRHGAVPVFVGLNAPFELVVRELLFPSLFWSRTRSASQPSILRLTIWAQDWLRLE